MFAYILNNVFQYFIPQGTGFEIDGVQYPANWLNLSTPAEKAAVGIVDVVYGPYANDQYYWVSQDAPVYADGVVTVNYTATPKDLDQLKTQAVANMQQQAYSILLPSDWRVVKGYETKSEIPTEWNTWRQEIRTQCDNQIILIDACQDVAELAALPAVEWAHDPNWVEPVNESNV